MRLIIVRHCKTILNEQNKLQGISDLGLSMKGVRQARKLAVALKNENVEVIHSSRFKRAVQTAEIINKFHNVPLLKEKALNEMSYGIFEGMTIDEIKDRYPQSFKEWRKNEFGYAFPKGDSLSSLKQRLGVFIESILNKKKDAMIVAHGEVSRVLLGNILKWDNERIVSTH